MTLSLRVDPDSGGGEWRDLFPSDGEFVGAMRGMQQRTSVLTRVPDAVFIELYAYEVLERSREFGTGAVDETWRIPFLADALFAAADVRVHAGRELEGMMPPFDEVLVVTRPIETLVAESNRVLGAVRFDPKRYATALADMAASRGWQVAS